MHANRWLRPNVTLVLAVAAMLAGAAVPSGAGAATVDLGRVGFGSIAVDNAARRVFVSEPAANTIDEFNFKGALVATVPNIYGAWGMTMSRGDLYVTESTTGKIVRITPSAPVLSPQTVAEGLNDPLWLVKTGGRLWATEDPGGQWGSIVSVDLTSHAVNTLPGNYYEPDLAVSPGDASTLFIAEDGLSAGAVYRLDVATSPVTQVAVNPSTDQSNIEGLAVSHNGKRVIPASGAPYLFEELSASTLKSDGVRYPGSPYPSAVAVSASGLLATGLNNGYSTPDIAVYRLGNPVAKFTATTNNPDGTANVLPHGLALSAGGRTLFAVCSDESQDISLYTYTVPRATTTAVR